MASRILCVLVVALALFPAFSLAQAQGNELLVYGDTVTGQITAETYFEGWVFQGSEGDEIQITMTSSQVDSYLALLESTSEEIIAEDDDSGGGQNARIEITLPTSDLFIIVATRYGIDTGTTTGSYQLSLESSAATTTTTTTTNTNTNTTTTANEPQELSEGVYYMGLIELDQPIRDTITYTSFAHVYSIHADAPINLGITMAANATNLDPYIMVVNSDNESLGTDNDSGAALGGREKDAYVEVALPQAGDYYIYASRFGMESGTSFGSYVITVSQIDEMQPVSQEQTDVPDGMAYIDVLTVGDQTTGTLDNTTFIHLYTFEGTADQSVTITMSSADDLDPYLAVLDEANNVLAEDDDSGGGPRGLDAQIVFTVPTDGTFIIIATRAGLDTGTTVGRYSLAFTSGGSGLSSVLPGRSVEVEGTTIPLRGGMNKDSLIQQELAEFSPDCGLCFVNPG
jgi:hypothetical protein